MESSSIAATTDELEHVAHQTLSLLSHLIDFDHASIVLLQQNKLVPLVSTGIQIPDSFPNALSVCSWVCDQQEAVIIDDVSQDLRYHMVDPSTQSELAVPLIVDGTTQGVLNLESHQLAHFTGGDLTLAQSLAEPLALSIYAIKTKRHKAGKLLRSQSLRQAEMLSNIALQTGSGVDTTVFFADVLQKIEQFFHANLAAIWTFNTATNTLSLQSMTKHDGQDLSRLANLSIEDSGVIATTYRSRSIFIEDNLSDAVMLSEELAATSNGLQQLMVAPLVAASMVYGVLLVARTEQAPFTEHDANFIKVIGRQIGTLLANVALYKQEKKRANFLHVINQISSEVSTLLDFNELAHRIVSSIQETLGYEIIQLLLRDGDNLIVKGSIDANGDQPESGRSFPADQRISGRAVRTARSYIVANVQLDPDYVAAQELPNVKSQLAVPIVSKGRVLGALVLYSSEAAFFDSIDREAMESLASQAAIAIENARLYQELQKRLQEQSIVYQIGQDINSILDIRSLTETLVYQVANAINADATIVMLYSIDGEDLNVQASYGLDDMSEIALEALRTYITDTQSASIYMRQPILISPEQTTKYAKADGALLALFRHDFMLIVPLSTGSAKPVGYIIWMARGEDSFPTTSVRLAETLANQSAVAIERARLQEETRRQLQRETILRRVAEAASSWAEQEAMLDAVSEETNRALRAVRCNIYLLEENTLRLLHTQAATSRYQPIDHSVVLQLDDMPSIRAALNIGSVVTLEPDAEDLSEAERSHFEKQGYGSLMMASMISQNTLLGAIEVFSSSSSREYSPADKSLLEAIASEVSVAIDNSRLYAREQRRRALLEKIQSSSEKIAAELQVNTLLEVVVQQIVSVFSIDAADILVQDRQTMVYHVQATTNLSASLTQNRQLTPDAMRAVFGDNLSSVITSPAETLVAPAHLLQTEGFEIVFSIPLLRGDVLFGALNMYSKTARQFTENERDLAEILSRQIAISLDNASLFGMLEERARQLAEVNRLKNEFLANVSHELRTPMNSIIGFTDTILLGVYGPLNETQEDRLSKVKHNALNLLTLIDDLLDLSKIEAGHMTFQIEHTNIATELHEVCATFEPQIAEKDVALVKNFADSLPLVNVDRQRLRQVVINLISNAVKFTSEGTITVSAQPEMYDQTSVVHFVVSDTGIGISEENLQVIFDEFRQVDGSSTRQYEGTGLGLAICRKLIDMMDGEIWVESTPGQGSSFHVVIPTIEAAG